MPRALRAALRALLVLALLLALAAGVVAYLNLRGEGAEGRAGASPSTAAAAAAAPGSAAQIERGRYLALAGNCAGCHTARGGADYAGGLGIATPFGTVYATNLTPDAEAGIGRWTPDDFWRAMHHGRSKDGRLLYPAFPYPSFTHLAREDSDAIHAWLRTLPADGTRNTPHRLRFPYDTQLALAVWRALFFRPGGFVADPARPAEWNRGAYLVEGLGHCIACHGVRNTLGATDAERGLDGGLIPIENWYAPSLRDPREAGVADWPRDEVVALLKTGSTPRGSVLGPMADVVFRSTQYLSDADLRAMATYLQALPPSAADRDATPSAAARDTPIRRDAGVMARGERIYAQRCAYCHGDAGQGAEGAYPPLAGNRAVLMDSTVNLVQLVRRGGFLPATAGNPRPYGMPPFGHVLDDNGIADVLSYVRGAWGNDAPPIARGQMIRP